MTCHQIYNDDFIENLQLSVTIISSWNSVSIYQHKNQNKTITAPSSLSGMLVYTTMCDLVPRIVVAQDNSQWDESWSKFTWKMAAESVQNLAITIKWHWLI